MKLSELLTKEEMNGLSDCEINTITDDSRKVGKNDIYIAITGRNFDGHSVCSEMLEKGAAAVVVERDLGLKQQIITDNSRLFYSVLASRYYGSPTKRLKLIAVTGTNGKTTIANLIRDCLVLSGKKCGCIGTAGYDVCGKTYEARFTTPYQMDLYRYFREMADNGAEYCVMEASSQALSQFRFSGERFICGIFTNLTQDHLDWHGTMENYYLAKKALFDCCDNAAINIDDPWGKRLYKELSEENRDINLISLSVEVPSDIYGSKINLKSGETSFWLSDRLTERAYYITLPMIGRFNVMNSLSVAAALKTTGLDTGEIAALLPETRGVRGRAEVLFNGDYTVICDYAHTEDGLHKTLSVLREFTENRLIAVFGAAGERDSGKRPSMGKTVSEYADIAVITSDNPRFEDPEVIINQVKTGFSGKCVVKTYVDRLEAIKYAVSIAEKGDVIALCGKGHEEYQVIGDDYIPFSEHSIIKELCGKEKE